ncbi:restriction endonuclease subunit S [Hymenobacter artigasi]
MDYDATMRRGIPKIDDIIITTEAPLGEVALIKTNERIAIAQRVILFSPNIQKVVPQFLYYSFLTQLVQERLYAKATGTTVVGISNPGLKSIKIPLPPLPLQRQIAAVLGRYDALLENYQGQVAALEGLALELYREWFVRGRCPGAAVGSAGELPAGWEVRRLGDVIELKYGKALIAEDRVPGEFPVVGSSGIVDFHDEPLINRPGIVVGRKGNVGSVIWLDKPFYPIDTVFYVESELSSYYLFYDLQMQNFISGDAAVPGLNREQALGNKVVVPDANSLAEFDRIVGPIFKKRLNLNNQIDLLRATRDALLPRLLSGQLVPAAAPVA